MKKPRKWKVNTGIGVMMIGIVLGAATEKCPVAEWVPWFTWLSGIANKVWLVIAGSGAGLALYGNADRTEKAIKGQI